jgi:hypothetical protein
MHRDSFILFFTLLTFIMSIQQIFINGFAEPSDPFPGLSVTISNQKNINNRNSNNFTIVYDNSSNDVRPDVPHGQI